MADQYSIPFTLTTNATVKTFAAAATFADSATATAGFTVAPAAPTFQPNGGTFSGSVQVALATTPGASIHYTVDGSAPTDAAGLLYDPVAQVVITSALPAGTVIKAIAFGVNLTDSAVTTSLPFTINAVATTPTISPNGRQISTVR